MKYKSIIKTLLAVTAIASLQSCDKDFSEIGSEIIGDNDLNIETYQVNDIVSYTQPYGVVETKNLISMPFGSLDNSEFGRVNSSFVTQVLSSSTTFDGINTSAVVDSVYVYVPYYSTYDKVEDDVTYYKLDNVTGEGSFNLEVYQNNYYLNNANPGTGQALAYYSNWSSIFEANKKPNPLNDLNSIQQSREVTFTKKNIIIYKKDKNGNTIINEDTKKPEVSETLAPGLWLDLDKAPFQRMLIDVIANRVAFKDPAYFSNYFRGLYFKASNNSTKGLLGMVNLTNGKLVIRYKQEIDDINAEGESIKKTVYNSITLPFSNISDTNSYSRYINVSLNSKGDAKTLPSEKVGDKEKGDERVYVKGGEGSVAVIDLLSSNDFEELKKLREMNVMINDAVLTVHVDVNAMDKNQIPKRLYLYNYDNGLPLSDFLNDSSVSTEYSKLTFGGIYQAANAETGIAGNTYKFRIAEYIRALIKNKTDKSPKLAISATNNYTDAMLLTVSNGVMNKLQEAIPNNVEDVKSVPTISTMFPLGTVLHGTKTTGKERMTLQIFYTKTKK